jgi:hypothetical protein
VSASSTAQRPQQLRLLDAALGTGLVDQRVPTLVLGRHLSPEPAALADGDAGFVEGELPGPGREPALAAVVVQSSEDGTSASSAACTARSSKPSRPSTRASQWGILRRHFQIIRVFG